MFNYYDESNYHTINGNDLCFFECMSDKDFIESYDRIFLETSQAKIFILNVLHRAHCFRTHQRSNIWEHVSNKMNFRLPLMIQFIQFELPTEFFWDFLVCSISLRVTRKDMTCELLTFELASRFHKLSSLDVSPTLNSDFCDILRFSVI